MGLFDDIDALTTTRDDETQQKSINQAEPTPLPGEPAAGQGSNAATTARPATKSPAASPGRQPRPRPAPRKPERLAFLRPCPLCEGRQFIHGAGSGFFCVTCQPGQQGQPVEAGGPDRQAPAAIPEDLKPAREDETPRQANAQTTEPTEEQRAYFRAAVPWITNNKQALLAAGWTPAALYRRAKFRWPYGPWGIAWLPTWSRPGLAVTIGRRGEIVFTFTSCGQTITQTAHPPGQRTR